MRCRSLVLSSVVALGLSVAPSIAHAQRVWSPGCRFGYDCSWSGRAYDRGERSRLRADERAARAEARAEARADAIRAREDARAWTRRADDRAWRAADRAWRDDRDVRRRERMDLRRDRAMRRPRFNW